MNQSVHRMGKMFPWRALGGLALAIVAVLSMVHPASAASVRVSDAHILAHFDLATGQQPENIVAEPDGAVDLTFAIADQVVRVTPDGKTHILATLPAPAGGASTPILGVAFLGGIVRANDGTLYFTYDTGTSDLTGIWRLRPGGVPTRIAALPVNGFANGLALDEQTGLLYSTDSALGTIWRVPVHGGTPTAWASGPALAPTSFAGVNGIKVHNGAIWVTNLDAGTVLRIPIGRYGQAEAIETRATGLTFIDDFAFVGHGDTLLAALNSVSEVVLVKPDGTHTIILTAADGLSNPTSIAVHHETIFVPSAAYFTKANPNLLSAHI